jgi:hypothetical protein
MHGGEQFLADDGGQGVNWSGIKVAIAALST